MNPRFSKWKKSLFGNSLDTPPDSNLSSDPSGSPQSPMESKSGNTEQLKDSSQNIKPTIVDLTQDENYMEGMRTFKQSLNDRVTTEFSIIKSHLQEITSEEQKTETANNILRELEGLKSYYTDDNDKKIVQAVMFQVVRYASPGYKKQMEKTGHVPSRNIENATVLLNDVYEKGVDFKEVFRFEPLVEQKEQENRPNLAHNNFRK